MKLNSNLCDKPEVYVRPFVLAKALKVRNTICAISNHENEEYEEEEGYF